MRSHMLGQKVLGYIHKTLMMRNVVWCVPLHISARPPGNVQIKSCTCMHTYTCAQTKKHAQTCTQTHTQVPACTFAHANIHTKAYVRAHVHTNTRKCANFTHKYISKRRRMDVCTSKSYVLFRDLSLQVDDTWPAGGVKVLLHAYLHTRARTHRHLYKVLEQF